jgi:hypothetical protein
MKKSWIIIGLLAAVILAASFASVNWTTGYADTVPTVPTIPSAYVVSPVRVQVNGPDVVLTITGKNFIDKTWTQVRWLGPKGGLPSYLVTTSVSADQTTLTATIPASMITKTGVAYLWVVNHPTMPNEFELAGPLTLPVVNIYYAPIIKR